MSASTTPEQLGAYRILAELAANQTYLALGPGDRRVVLKKLADDCLLGQQLHSQIRDRLAAIRGLAHPQVANLYAVERAAGFTFVVWEHVDAQPFDQWAIHADRELRHVIALTRELVLAVEALHALGIVHGRLHPANVFVRDGRIRLTHASPLLYTDPREDTVAIVRLLRDVIRERGETDSPLGLLLDKAEQKQMPLAQLGSALAALVDSRTPAPRLHEPPQELTPRGRSITAAVIVGLIGILIAWGIWQYTSAIRPTPPVPPEIHSP